MAGHTRGDLTPASYFERYIACLVRKSGDGELRVSGAEFDKLTNEATTLTFYWDSAAQEIVVRGARAEELVIDTFRVNPENSAQRTQPQSRIVDPLDKTLFRVNQQQHPSNPPLEFTRSSLRPIDDAAAKEAEDERVLARAKQLVREMIKRNQNVG